MIATRAPQFKAYSCNPSFPCRAVPCHPTLISYASIKTTKHSSRPPHQPHTRRVRNLAREAETQQTPTKQPPRAPLYTPNTDLSTPVLSICFTNVPRPYFQNPTTCETLLSRRYECINLVPASKKRVVSMRPGKGQVCVCVFLCRWGLLGAGGADGVVRGAGFEGQGWGGWGVECEDC